MEDNRRPRCPIPRTTMERLPGYLNFLRMQTGPDCERISSAAIAQEMNLSAITVRKDLACVASGRPRVGYLRGELAANEMQEVLDAAAEAGADKIFVTYLAGTVQPAAHSSWMPATANTAVRDWIFAQVNDAPYAG